MFSKGYKPIVVLLWIFSVAIIISDNNCCMVVLTESIQIGKWYPTFLDKVGILAKSTTCHV